jgi:peroxiredoxin
MIEVGEPVPDVQLTDTGGTSVRLRDFQGESSVLVYFMRHTGCPVCNRHVQRLAAAAADYAARGVAVLVAVPDDVDSAARWASRKQLPFPVVTGTEGSPHEIVGLRRKLFGTMQQSGTVLVDRGGVVRHVDVATIPTGGYSHSAVDEAISALRSTER